MTRKWAWWLVGGGLGVTAVGFALPARAVTAKSYLVLGGLLTAGVGGALLMVKPKPDSPAAVTAFLAPGGGGIGVVGVLP